MKKLNKMLILLFSLGIIVYVVINHQNLTLGQTVQALLSIVIFLVPYILKKLFKFELSDISICIYLLFTFQGYVLGNVASLYKKTTFFDTYMHFITGIVGALIALVILIKLKKYNKKDIVFNVIFIAFTVLAISASWEMIEFTMDHLFGMNTQRVETGVNDTMKDIIAAFFGMILFNMWYVYEIVSNSKLLISKYILEEEKII